MRLACAAREGFQPRLGLGGGGADANIFNERGKQCVNIANGMAAIHTADEHIIADLERMVDVTLALVDVARDAASLRRGRSPPSRTGATGSSDSWSMASCL